MRIGIKTLESTTLHSLRNRILEQAYRYSTQIYKNDVKILLEISNKFKIAFFNSVILPK